MKKFWILDHLNIQIGEEESIGKPKVGHGKIHNFDGTFVFLIGEKGRLALNRKDITAIKQ